MFTFKIAALLLICKIQIKFPDSRLNPNSLNVVITEYLKIERRIKNMKQARNDGLNLDFIQREKRIDNHIL